MREMPDIRAEARECFEALKTMLVNNVKDGHQFAPVYMFVTLTPFGQATLNKPEVIALVPEWTNDRDLCIQKIVKFLNQYAECVILCASGRGSYAGPDFSDDSVANVFVTIYAPGFEPWTLGQMYTIVEKEVIFDRELCSSEGNIAPFPLPGLWPNGVAP